MTAALNEWTQWIDELTGELIVDGFVFFGFVNSDPTVVNNQITVYLDSELTTPTAQPVRTGPDGRTVTKIWVDRPYSIEVQNSSMIKVFESADNGEPETTDLPPGYLDGYELTRIDATSFSIDNGSAKDSTDTKDLVLDESPILVKTTAAWTEGANGGSLDSGSLTPNTTYTVFAILQTSTENVDIQISTAASPAVPPGYLLFANIGLLTINTSLEISNVFGPSETIGGVTLSEGSVGDVGIRSINGNGTWGFRRLNANGDMRISQRGKNTTIETSVGFTETKYGPDQIAVNGRGTPQARADLKHVSTGGPEGFPNYFSVDITTAEGAVGASEAAWIGHAIEGDNLQQLLFGAAAAQSIAITWRMESPKSGLHSVSIYNPAANESFVTEFTVAVANTFETHTVIIPGDVASTIVDSEAAGIQIRWAIFGGTAFVAPSSDIWETGEFIVKSGADQNLADSTANDINITGIDIEVVAPGATEGTAFEYLPISVELPRCMRYFERVEPLQTQGTYPCIGISFASSAFRGIFIYEVSKRAIPGDITISADSTLRWVDGQNVARGIASSSVERIDKYSFRFAGTAASQSQGGGFLQRNATDVSTVDISAELGI